ncbi:MAG: mechanosensitive ion channel [Brasilonema angustatum HA4187-MV1]|jgi:small-conductance mechanosensitive channel|nr:mechanosensitive ion channel [Brasilonema angustatum HA4187-MV1]
MNTSNWNEPWFIWAIALGFGFPLLTIVLEEVIQQLKRRNNAFAPILQLVKNFVLPTFILLVFVRDVFRLDQQGSLSKILETLFLISAINIVLSLINVWLFERTQTESWQSRIPKLLINLCHFLAILIGGLLILSKVWSVDLAGLATALVVVALVMGLALKDPLGGILTGIMVVFERPYRVGDWLKVGEVEGQVTDINWRSVRLLTTDRKAIILPYQVIGQEVVCNHTGNDHFSSATIKLSFSYDNPPNLVKRVLTNTALSVRGILETPPPECTPVSYEGSFITYELEFYVKDFAAVKPIRGELMSRLWYAARRNGLVLYHYNYECQVELPTNRVENSKHKLSQSFSSIPAFIPLTKEQRQLDDLAKGTTIQHFGAGEQIVCQGERVRTLYVIIAGSASMTVQDDADADELKVLTLCPGEFFGVQSLFSRSPSPVSFMAAEDIEVMVIGADALDAMLVRQPSLSHEMAKVIEVRENAINVAKRANQTEQRSIDNGHKTID